jgi:myosin heavy subunit
MSDLSTEVDSGYRRGGGQRRPTKRGGGGSAKTLGTSVILVVLLAGLVVAGWFIWNQQRLLMESENRMGAARDKTEELEARIMANENAMGLEGRDTKEQIGFWEDEIRKLWTITNERNKKWIKDNERALKKITSTINGIEASNRDLKAAVGQHDTALSQQRTLIDQLASLEQQMEQMVRGQRDLVDKTNTANQGLASIRATLQGKVDDNAEAIQAIDAYRVAVNSRLANIERRMSQRGTPAVQ